ncbi:DEAD/DEAH box helicase [Nubsella zeaxanthinifaciens]|uniref:DEAD/DEAH box helicase n=1 Tax=Nubsella zeaxanthinifaciens TaxID=392412 RepID=UPI000DE216DB|nr:DEAD/DEAH box helicase [Nubsella zeaxanthinifaciens]
MSLEQLKLSKPLVAAMSALGHLSAKEIQSKTVSRILGGQDIIAIGPEGSGKTTTYVLATLMRLKTGGGDAPRALILVPNKEKVLEVIACFNQLNRNSTFKIVGIHADEPIDEQVEELTSGVDIIVAIPSRARAIYLKLGLNTNKIQMLVLDDAADLVKQGLQLPVNELANSIQKCQHLVFTDVMHERLEKMIADFMFMPATIEVDEVLAEKVETYTQLVYHVPNFRTKLNLLNLLLSDKEVFDKVVVFVNTRLTAQTLSKDLFDGKAEDIFVHKPLFFDEAGFESLEAFKVNEKARVLIVANENFEESSLSGIPFVFHFELPEDRMLYINRVLKKEDVDFVALNFIADLELSELRKIEQATGQKMEEADLPDDLLVEDTSKTAKVKTKNAKELERQQAEEEAFRNAAFQPKKESNAKTTNYSSGEKARMNKQKKHG